jgi:hypothetical protein
LETLLETASGASVRKAIGGRIPSQSVLLVSGHVAADEFACRTAESRSHLSA